MSRFNLMPKKHAEEFQISRVRFLGEQDGPPELELKCRLGQFFQNDQTVTAAYLARVMYGDESYAVALCLRSQLGKHRRLAEKVGKIFASIFGSHEHLDIIFLSETQQAELAIVCKAFYQAG